MLTRSGSSYKNTANLVPHKNTANLHGFPMIAQLCTLNMNYFYQFTLLFLLLTSNEEIITFQNHFDSTFFSLSRTSQTKLWLKDGKQTDLKSSSDKQEYYMIKLINKALYS